MGNSTFHYNSNGTSARYSRKISYTTYYYNLNSTSAGASTFTPNNTLQGTSSNSFLEKTLRVKLIMKPIHFIISVCAVIILLICFKSCSNSGKKKAIESVLEQDHQISNRAPITSESSDINAWLKKYEFIVTEMRAIDLSACPDDFAQAFSYHCQAWVDNYRVIQDIKSYQGKDTFWNGFLNGLNGRSEAYINELNADQARIQQKGEEANKAIYDTYDKVLEIASKYGVKTAKYR